MASKSFIAPLIRHASTRGYAHAAPVVRKEVKFTSCILPNKTIVAALDNGSPVTRVTVAFRAGSRYEPLTELGLTHVLRSAAGMTTSCVSNFILSRKLAQIGASITASGDREFVYYTVEATQDQLPEALECLRKMISCQEFRPWELDDNVPRLKFDIAALPPQVRAVDLLHKAAYRRGLGNSLFIAPKKIGKISSESLRHYVACRFAPEVMAVTVVGDTEEKAKWIATNLQLSGQLCDNSEPSKYYGGELRKEIGGDLAHVALAVPGAPAGSPQSLALAIAAKALGNGPVTKWGADNSLLARAAGNVGPFAAAGFNVSYSDSGLFGVVLSVPKDEVATAVKSVSKVLKNPSLNGNEIQAGKNQLKLQVLSEAEAGASTSESMAAQALYTGCVKSPGEIAATIDALPNAEVEKALHTAVRSSMSMGAVGNLVCVPYVDEL